MNLKLEFKVAEEDLAKKDAYFSNLQDIERQLQNYPGEIKKIDTALSKEPSVPMMFYYFQKVVSENGLILNNINYRESSAASTESPVFSFSLGVSGSYDSLKKLLSALYSNSKLFEVNSISFSSSAPSSQSQGQTGQNQPGYFNFSLEVKTSFLGQKDATPENVLQEQ